MTTTPRADRPSSSTRRRLAATIISLLGSDCAACGHATIVGGSPSAPWTFNLGHVRADANGGTRTIGNLLPCCRRCNVTMGGTDWDASGAPMLVKPLAEGTRLVADPGSETFPPAPWARTA